jgi:hypothetical protein
MSGELQSNGERNCGSDNDGKWQLNQILYTDDTTLVADKESKLQSLVTEFGKIYERRKLPGNAAKSKVMRVTRRGNSDNINITVNGVRMEVECFGYLGVNVDRDGGMKSEMKYRASEEDKVSGVLRKMWKGQGLSIHSK